MSLRPITAVLGAVLCATAALPAPTAAQGAGILRPSVISESSHTLSVPGVLAGYTLGDSTSSAVARLGRSLKIDTISTGSDPLISYANLGKGITLIATNGGGVGIIFLTRPEAGTLDGIRVGDTRATAIARWGPAAAGGKGTGKGGALWLTDENVVAVTFDESGRISQLGIGRGFSQ